MTAGLEIYNDSGVLLLSNNRTIPVLLGKDSTPSGTLFTAIGANHTYAFGRPSGSGASYGMQVLDENGGLLFDALQFGKSARIVGEMSGNIGSILTQTVSRTFTSGRTYAVWLFSPVSPLFVRNIETQIGGNINYQYVLDEQTMTVSISDGTVNITATRIESSNPAGGSIVPYTEGGKTDWRAAVLDVTHY